MACSVTIAERNGDRSPHALRADYVVGCDGSHSIVREQAGITQTLSDHDRLMVLLVFRSQRPARAARSAFPASRSTTCCIPT